MRILKVFEPKGYKDSEGEKPKTMLLFILALKKLLFLSKTLLKIKE